jgi:DNA (cytosine-5)-methyltransferase 1
LKRRLAIDLFSGCGGVSEGLRQAGFQVVGAVEIDALAGDTYAQNHPDTKLWRADIRELLPREMLQSLAVKKGQVAILAACAPCQGFSRLRTLNRLPIARDSRNDLVLRVLPFVAEFLPQSVMLENVPGAQYSEEMIYVRSRLRSLGYRFREAVLDVADYGVAQRRRRYILIGDRDRLPGFPKAESRRLTVREAIGHLPEPGQSGDIVHDVTAARSSRVVKLISQIPKDGGSRRALSMTNQLKCHQSCDGFSDVYGRMAWDKPAPTITSGFVNPSKGRFLHPAHDRAITPREGALLQGFPESYHFSMRRGKYGAAELIGNAVPPEFARRQASMLGKALTR